MKRFIALVTAAAVTASLLAASCSRQPRVTTDEATAIAKEAYIWGYPLVELYKVMYFYSVYRDSPEFKAPFNAVANMARVYTPADTTVQTPNADTPYSMAWLDLRVEPVVITVPPVEEGRYYSVQLVDQYTFNFDYIGTRTTGNGGGSYLVTGPGWAGTTPEGIAKVFACETQFALAIFRTQLFTADDIENVKKVQVGYAVQPLSAFAKTPAPEAPGGLLFPPYSPQTANTAGFFQYLNFVLQFAPAHPEDAEHRARFERIGIVPGEGFSVATMDRELRAAIEAGMTEASLDVDRELQRLSSSRDVFGTRAHLAGNFLGRAAGARLGLLGNSKEEALYFNYRKDADGQPLSGAGAYTIRFDADKMPPANAFWSVTMYDGVKQSLVDNPIGRYLINSPMLPGMTRDRDGGLTLYIQKDSPGKGKEANWLPAPAGEFYLVLRLYLPKPEALDGTWKEPAVTKVK
jgi:hypothetical protein